MRVLWDTCEGIYKHRNLVTDYVAQDLEQLENSLNDLELSLAWVVATTFAMANAARIRAVAGEDLKSSPRSKDFWWTVAAAMAPQAYYGGGCQDLEWGVETWRKLASGLRSCKDFWWIVAAAMATQAFNLTWWWLPGSEQLENDADNLQK